MWCDEALEKLGLMVKGYHKEYFDEGLMNIYYPFEELACCNQQENCNELCQKYFKNE